MARRILVVDDEPRLAQSLSALLRGNGHEVKTAIGGHEGLKALRDEEFDLVITDLRMPDVDGFEVMKFVRDCRPRTRIIVITGHASTESAIEAMHQDAADYIPKPFDFDLLKASVEKVFANLEAEQLRSDLARMFSHDIKVPLTSIVGFAEILTKPGALQEPKATEFAQKIVGNSRRILALIENYLTHARVEEGRLEIHPQAFDIVAVVREALRVVEHDMHARGHRVAIDVPESMMLEGDEPLVFRACSNLLGNAAKYAPDGAMIGVSVRRGITTGGRPAAELRIWNDGVEVPCDECSALFERYRRGRTAKGTGGTGLGLHVVKLVAEAHRGDAWAESHPEEGRIAFHVRIPIEFAK